MGDPHVEGADGRLEAEYSSASTPQPLDRLDGAVLPRMEAEAANGPNCVVDDGDKATTRPLGVAVEKFRVRSELGSLQIPSPKLRCGSSTTRRATPETIVWSCCQGALLCRSNFVSADSPELN